MKKILGKIGSFFGTVIGIAVALLFGVFLIFLMPLDYIKYKRSLYYKRERKKYKPFAATGEAFDIYNEILKNDLPIKYISNPKDEGLVYGWFVYDHTLLILNDFSFSYNSQTGNWEHVYEITDEDGNEKQMVTTIAEYIESEIQDANELAGETICDNAVILMDADCIDDLEQAKNEKCFLIYDGNREEVLKNFCK